MTDIQTWVCQQDFNVLRLQEVVECECDCMMGGGVQLRFTALPDTLNPSQSIIRRVVYLRPSQRQAGVDWDSVGLRLSQASFTLPADERLRPAAITQLPTRPSVQRRANLWVWTLHIKNQGGEETMRAESVTRNESGSNVSATRNISVALDLS